MKAIFSCHAQLAEEVDGYERVRRREIAPRANLTQVGRLLIGLRIANGLAQRELDALEETQNLFVVGVDLVTELAPCA